MEIKQLEKFVAEKIPSLNGLSPFVAYLNVLHDHDRQLYFHSLRVGYYATKIAENEKWPERQAHLAFVGGLLHDFGKVKFSPLILHMKNPDDWHYNELKKHVHYGLELLSPFSKEVASVAGGHHLFQVNSYGSLHPSLSMEECAQCLDAILIISMSDFWDAHNTRKTNLMYNCKKMSHKEALLSVYKSETRRAEYLEKITSPSEMGLSLSR